MERRLHERVQFFQLMADSDGIPVWVFQKAHAESVLGLVLDISAEGIQILTDKSTPLPSEQCHLIVHAEESLSTPFFTAAVHRLWSKADGAIYVRNGFAFDGEKALTQQIERVLADRVTGRRWLRCELAAIG